jgi:hypothetical protein
MADIFEGSPEFTDLEVVDEWTDTTGVEGSQPADGEER